MATRTMRWSPDTCQCVIEQVFDGSTDPATFLGNTFIKACALHKAAKADDVHAENISKNQAVAAVTQAANAILGKEDVLAHEVGWAFDQDRKVQITCPKELNGQQKATLTADLADIKIV